MKHRALFFDNLELDDELLTDNLELDDELLTFDSGDDSSSSVSSNCKETNAFGTLS